MREREGEPEMQLKRVRMIHSAVRGFSPFVLNPHLGLDYSLLSRSVAVAAIFIANVSNRVHGHAEKSYKKLVFPILSTVRWRDNLM